MSVGCMSYFDAHMDLKEGKPLKFPQDVQLQGISKKEERLQKEMKLNQKAFDKLISPPWEYHSRLKSLFRLQKLEDKYWLIVNAPYERLFPAVLVFLQSNKVSMTSQDVKRGVVEFKMRDLSDVLPSFSDVPIESTMILKVVNSLYVDSSEIFIQFSGEQQSYPDQQNDFFQKFIQFYKENKPKIDDQHVFLDAQISLPSQKISVAYCCEDIFFLEFAFPRIRLQPMIRSALEVLSEQGKIQIHNLDFKQGRLNISLTKEFISLPKSRFFIKQEQQAQLSLIETTSGKIQLVLKSQKGALFSKALTDEFNYYLWKTMLR